MTDVDVHELLFKTLENVKEPTREWIERYLRVYGFHLDKENKWILELLDTKEGDNESNKKR